MFGFYGGCSAFRLLLIRQVLFERGLLVRLIAAGRQPLCIQVGPCLSVLPVVDREREPSVMAGLSWTIQKERVSGLISDLAAAQRLSFPKRPAKSSVSPWKGPAYLI